MLKFATMSATQATETGLAETVERNLPALAELCRRFGVRRLDLFGSAATGRFDPLRSDLDFLVEFETPPAGGFGSPYFRLLEELETLFGRKVDLLTIPGLKNPYLRQQIFSERRMLFPQR
jgi:predicted nucleotidyltransferase